MSQPTPAQEVAAFISYSRADSEFALRLAQDLKAAGAHVWLDQLDIHAGHEWDNAIEAALVGAQQMLLILSPDSANSRNVRNEVALALDEGKVILPILHRDCTVPLQLRRLQHIDFRTDYARGFSLLLRHMQEQPSGESASPTVVAPQPAQPAPQAQPAPKPNAQPSPPLANAPQPPRPQRSIGCCAGTPGLAADPAARHPHRPHDLRPRRLHGLQPLCLGPLLTRRDRPEQPFGQDVSAARQVGAALHPHPQRRHHLHRPLARSARPALQHLRLARLPRPPGDGAQHPLRPRHRHRQVLLRHACAEQDKNAAFVSAMEGSKVPIVVGQQTYALADESNRPAALRSLRGSSSTAPPRSSTASPGSKQRRPQGPSALARLQPAASPAAHRQPAQPAGAGPNPIARGQRRHPLAGRCQGGQPAA